MGCAVSTLDDNSDRFVHEKRINDAINQTLQLHKQQDKNNMKVLLLGAGESGKSTVLKQMRLLHKGGFTQQERQQYAHVIWADIIQSMRLIIMQARRMDIPLQCDDPKSPLVQCKRVILNSDALATVDTDVAGGLAFLNDYVIKYSSQTKNKRRLASTGNASAFCDEKPETYNSNSNENDAEIENEVMQMSHKPQKQNYSRKEIAEAVWSLWKYDNGIKRCCDRANEFQLETSAAYYFDNVHNFIDVNYSCSDMDILKGRIKTTGITETNFVIDSFKFKVLDAGGQRSERKKWIHCFDNITAILFVLAISEYDQMLFEDERVNRMHESILLFDALCNSRWFMKTPFILFLNKIDIFKEKLPKSPIKKYFPDYTGKSTDADEVLKFFEQNFLKLNRSNKAIYIHRTCATDTESMKFVLHAVTDLIIQDNLKKSGII
jgi:guanine nucleotide-binding protein subunit alpha